MEGVEEEGRHMGPEDAFWRALDTLDFLDDGGRPETQEDGAVFYWEELEFMEADDEDEGSPEEELEEGRISVLGGGNLSQRQ